MAEVDRIAKCVELCFPSVMISMSGDEFTSSIVADNEDGSFHMCILIYPISEKFDVDIYYIYLPKEQQRQGLFSKFVHSLCDIPNIYRIIISSIVTESMHAWCDVNGFIDRMPEDENTRYFTV